MVGRTDLLPGQEQPAEACVTQDQVDPNATSGHHVKEQSHDQEEAQDTQTSIQDQYDDDEEDDHSFFTTQSGAALGYGSDEDVVGDHNGQHQAQADSGDASCVAPAGDGADDPTENDGDSEAPVIDASFVIRIKAEGNADSVENLTEPDKQDKRRSTFLTEYDDSEDDADRKDVAEGSERSSTDANGVITGNNEEEVKRQYEKMMDGEDPVVCVEDEVGNQDSLPSDQQEEDQLQDQFGLKETEDSNSELSEDEEEDNNNEMWTAQAYKRLNAIKEEDEYETEAETINDQHVPIELTNWADEVENYHAGGFDPNQAASEDGEEEAKGEENEDDKVNEIEAENESKGHEENVDDQNDLGVEEEEEDDYECNSNDDEYEYYYEEEYEDEELENTEEAVEENIESSVIDCEIIEQVIMNTEKEIPNQTEMDSNPNLNQNDESPKNYDEDIQEEQNLENSYEEIEHQGHFNSSSTDDNGHVKVALDESHQENKEINSEQNTKECLSLSEEECKDSCQDTAEIDEPKQDEVEVNIADDVAEEGYSCEITEDLVKDEKVPLENGEMEHIDAEEKEEYCHNEVEAKIENIAQDENKEDTERNAVSKTSTGVQDSRIDYVEDVVEQDHSDTKQETGCTEEDVEDGSVDVEDDQTNTGEEEDNCQNHKEIKEENTERDDAKKGEVEPDVLVKKQVPYNEVDYVDDIVEQTHSDHKEETECSEKDVEDPSVDVEVDQNNAEEKKDKDEDHLGIENKLENEECNDDKEVIEHYTIDQVEDDQVHRTVATVEQEHSYHEEENECPENHIEDSLIDVISDGTNIEIEDDIEDKVEKDTNEISPEHDAIGNRASGQLEKEPYEQGQSRGGESEHNLKEEININQIKDEAVCESQGNKNESGPDDSDLVNDELNGDLQEHNHQDTSPSIDPQNDKEVIYQSEEEDFPVANNQEDLVNDETECPQDNRHEEGNGDQICENHHENIVSSQLSENNTEQITEFASEVDPDSNQKITDNAMIKEVQDTPSLAEETEHIEQNVVDNPNYEADLDQGNDQPKNVDTEFKVEIESSDIINEGSNDDLQVTVTDEVIISNSIEGNDILETNQGDQPDNNLGNDYYRQKDLEDDPRDETDIDKDNDISFRTEKEHFAEDDSLYIARPPSSELDSADLNVMENEGDLESDEKSVDYQEFININENMEVEVIKVETPPPAGASTPNTEDLPTEEADKCSLDVLPDVINHSLPDKLIQEDLPVMPGVQSTIVKKSGQILENEILNSLGHENDQDIGLENDLETSAQNMNAFDQIEAQLVANQEHYCNATPEQEQIFSGVQEDKDNLDFSTGILNNQSIEPMTRTDMTVDFMRSIFSTSSEVETIENSKPQENIVDDIREKKVVSSANLIQTPELSSEDVLIFTLGFFMIFITLLFVN